MPVGRSNAPTSNSVVSRLPVDQPSSMPFSHTVNAESTPRNRSTACLSVQPGGRSNVRRYSPVGFSSGTCGGSTGNGYRTFVYAGRPCPCICQCPGTSIVGQSRSSASNVASARAARRNRHCPLRSTRRASETVLARGARRPAPGSTLDTTCGAPFTCSRSLGFRRIRCLGVGPMLWPPECACQAPSYGARNRLLIMLPMRGVRNDQSTVDSPNPGHIRTNTMGIPRRLVLGHLALWVPPVTRRSVASVSRSGLVVTRRYWLVSFFRLRRGACGEPHIRPVPRGGCSARAAERSAAGPIRAGSTRCARMRCAPSTNSGKCHIAARNQ